MQQRTTNAVVFGFLGAVLGLVLAGLSGFQAATEVSFAIVAGIGFGVIVGLNWGSAPQKRHDKTPV